MAKYKTLLWTLLATFMLWNNGSAYSIMPDNLEINWKIPRPGDVWLGFPADLATLATISYCSEYPVYHASIQGFGRTLITSSPNEGCGHTCEIGSCAGQLGYIVIRNKNATHAERIKAVLMAYTLPCEYDDVGYGLLWLKYLAECAGEDVDLLFPYWWPYYHCVSFVAKCWGFDNPHDIVPDDMINHPDWEIIGIY